MKLLKIIPNCCLLNVENLSAGRCILFLYMQVEEIMLTLKRAFQSAFQQNSSKGLVVCELCPMHQYHKLCQQLDSKLIEKFRF